MDHRGIAMKDVEAAVVRPRVFNGLLIAFSSSDICRQRSRFEPLSTDTRHNSFETILKNVNRHNTGSLLRHAPHYSFTYAPRCPGDDRHFVLEPHEPLWVSSLVSSLWLSFALGASHTGGRHILPSLLVEG